MTHFHHCSVHMHLLCLFWFCVDLLISDEQLCVHVIFWGWVMKKLSPTLLLQIFNWKHLSCKFQKWSIFNICDLPIFPLYILTCRLIIKSKEKASLKRRGHYHSGLLTYGCVSEILNCHWPITAAAWAESGHPGAVYGVIFLMAF